VCRRSENGCVTDPLGSPDALSSVNSIEAVDSSQGRPVSRMDGGALVGTTRSPGKVTASLSIPPWPFVDMVSGCAGTAAEREEQPCLQ